MAAEPCGVYPSAAATLLDVMRLLQHVTGIVAFDDLEILQGDIHPSVLFDVDSRPPLRYRVGDMDVTIFDTLLALRIAVGLEAVIEPR